MKLLEAEKMLRAYGCALQLAGADQSGGWLNQVADLLAINPKMEMAKFAEQSRAVLAASTNVNQEADGPRLSQISMLAASLREIMIASGSKDTKRLLDLELLVNLFNCDSQYLGSSLKRLRDTMMPIDIPSTVRNFIERLRRETGTPRFEESLVELDRSGLKREHVVEIATALYRGTKKGSSRKVALDNIRKPHDAYMSAKRGIDAMGGRSAA